MENLEDFYPDPDGSGRKWEPQDVGDTLVSLRSCHYGHVRNAVCPLVNGHPDFKQIKYFLDKNEPYQYIFKQEQRLPKEFLSSTVRAIMKKYEMP